jgi:hypothetical protein
MLQTRSVRSGIDVPMASTSTAAAPAVTLRLAIPLRGEGVYQFQVLALVLLVASLIGSSRAGSHGHRFPAALPAGE